MNPFSQESGRLAWQLVEFLLFVFIVAMFYISGAIPFDVEHIAFQFCVWCGGVALLRLYQGLQAYRGRPDVILSD